MNPVRFDAAAKFELREAMRFYEMSQRGLGRRFLDAVQGAVQRVAGSPGLFRTVWRDVRKCRVSRFPYGLLFREKADSVQIVAVMHLHRDPDYWKNRT